MIPALLAAQLIPAVAQTGFGAYQAIKGYSAQKNLVRPRYQIPQEVTDNLSDAQRMAIQGLPEQQQKMYVDNVQRGMNQGLQQLGTRQAGLAGIGGLVQNQNDAYRNLLAMSAQQQMANQQQLYGARNAVSEFKNHAFQVNQMEPYMNKAQMAQAMIGSGLQNAMG
jgi:hypothetical protein